MQPKTQLKLRDLPTVDLDNESAMKLLLPESLVELPRTARTALAGILPRIQPKEDPQPAAMILGWDAKAPTLDLICFDGRFFADGDTKHQLATGIRDMVLKRRAQEQETFGISLVFPGWIKIMDDVPKSELHIVQQSIERYMDEGLINEPDKVECMIVDTLWQDGQFAMLAPIIRTEGESPKLREWRNLSAGSAMIRNRWWHTIAPALCAVSYAEAVMAAMGTDTTDTEEGAK